MNESLKMEQAKAKIKKTPPAGMGRVLDNPRGKKSYALRQDRNFLTLT